MNFIRLNIGILIRPLFGAFLFLVASTFSSADGKPGSQQKLKPATAAVASAHPIATQAGIDILQQGGNAFDAAVAVSAALAVVEPYSSGLGGGGFWLLHRDSDNRQIMVDGRERAPLAATETLYQNEQGGVIPGLSIDGALAAGIPGEPAALVHIAKQYGQLPLEKTLAPAIQAARNGFAVDAIYQRMAEFRQKVLASSVASAKILLKAGTVPALGTRIIQTDLADTLQAMVDNGHDGFYKGDIAQKLVNGVRAAGGIWTKKDLAEYRVVERDPIRFRYQDMTVVSASPPSSGGIALAAMLNILSGYPLTEMKPESRVHLITEAMRRAYRDRAEYLGDPDFTEIPVEQLTSPWYAKGLAASIRTDRATSSDALPGQVTTHQGHHTTHFSIIDTQGNRVAATLSINYPFGSGFIAPGTGVLLNDEMDDFSAKPGVPNVYGLVGAQANAIAPGKRPLSSMSPTFVESDKGVAILGTPGGSRIITMVLLGLLQSQISSNPETWVFLPRFHHQYLPDHIQYEPDALSSDVIKSLKAKGHALKEVLQYGNMQAVFWDYKTGRVMAASDPRGVGKAKIVRNK